MTATQAVDLSWDIARSRARRTKRWSVHGPDVIDLTVAEMDLPIAAPIQDVLRDAIERQTVGYPIPRDRSGLPEIIAEWLTAVHGLATDPDAVQLLPELMRGITNSLRLYTPEGSPVVVPTPTYRSFFGAVELAGRRVVEAPMREEHGDYRLDIDRIAAGLAAGARSVILCHPANPVGRIFSPDELTELAEVVDRHGARVISDEIHAPLRYTPGFVPYAALSERTRAHTVTLCSASKAWNIPGLRTGFLALTNPADRPLWRTLPGPAAGGISPLGMVATAAALTDGGAWLREAVALLATRRDALSRRLIEAGFPDVHRPAEATYLAWLDLRDTALGGHPDPAAAFLAAGVATTPGPDHGTGGAGFVRLNFATEADVLDTALNRIVAVLRSAD